MTVLLSEPGRKPVGGTQAQAAGHRQGPARPRHIGALDGLRGVAILLVMLHHFSQATIPASLPGLWLAQFLQASWGINLFFLLSGFLITGLLLDARGAPHLLRNFHVRRMLRIFPLYFAVLTVALVALPRALSLGPAGRRLLDHAPALWVYGGNFATAAAGTWIFNGDGIYLNHLWSMAIEQHFYLIWPLAVVFLSRRKLVWCCGAVMVLALATRVGLWAAGASPVANYVLTPCRFDILGAGALVAVLFRTPGGLARARVPVALAAGAGLLGLMAIRWHDGSLVYSTAGMRTVGYSCQLVVCAALLVAVLGASSTSRLARVLRLRPLVLLGQYAYGLFLLHHLFQPAVVHVASPERLLPYVHLRLLANAGFMAIAMAVALAGAVASWHLYEKHFVGWKRYFPLQAAAKAPARRAAAA